MLAHDPLSSSAYAMITYTHPAAGNLPIKALVAKQRQTSIYVCTLVSSQGPFAEKWEGRPGT